MKILLFDNSSLTPSNNDFCCEPKTGLFASELLDLGNEIIMYGQKVKAIDTVHTYKLNEKGIRVVGLYRKKNKLINYILLYLRAIPEIFKADFVYIFYPNAFKYIAVFCILFGKRYGLYIRGEQSLDDKVSYLIYKKAFTVFTVSGLFTDFVNKIFQKNNANTIRPMIPFTEKDIIRDREYKIKEKYSILFLGRVAFDKGVEELLNAIKVLKDKNYALELIVVGNGEFMQDAIDITKDLGISDILSFKGAVFEPDLIRDFYFNADIYILPTYHEGFPRTLYEAMIFGTPIITTFVGGIPALMKDGVNCKEIKPKSIDSIVDTLIYAMENYREMGELAKNANHLVYNIVDSKRLTHAEHLNQFLISSK